MSEKENLTIEKTWIVNDVTVIALIGCLIDGAGFDVINYIEELIEHSCVKIIIDARQLITFDHMGLRHLLHACRVLKKIGGTLAFANLNDYLGKIFELLELSKISPIHNSVENALAELLVNGVETITLH